MAKSRITAEGYAEEIRWQQDLDFDLVTEVDFLREAAWVVLSSGMRETVIRRKFPSFSSAFLNWTCANLIWRRRKSCAKRAMSIFGHQGKVDAIIEIARRVSSDGFCLVKEQIASEGTGYLKTFPYLGPATACHLAKNLGIDLAKPDRHLVRVADAAGFDDPSQLCKEIADEVGDKPSVVDIVIWRFATIEPEYLAYFR